MKLTNVLILLLGFSVSATASTAGQVERLLTQNEAPAGVVFEVVEGDRKFLDWAVPEVKKYTDRLRRKYPNLSVAVVSHGKEQFALMKDKSKKHQNLHRKVQSLVKDDNITVHVCGTHAGWYNIQPEDFAGYINVATAAPAQINDYRALGFVVIRIRKN